MKDIQSHIERRLIVPRSNKIGPVMHPVWKKSKNTAMKEYVGSGWKVSVNGKEKREEESDCGRGIKWATGDHWSAESATLHWIVSIEADLWTRLWEGERERETLDREWNNMRLLNQRCCWYISGCFRALVEVVVCLYLVRLHLYYYFFIIVSYFSNRVTHWSKILLLMQSLHKAYIKHLMRSDWVLLLVL